MTHHIPVMLKEMLHYLSPQGGEIYLDATFGAGGYSRAILESCACRVVAIDQDPDVKIYADTLTAKYKDRFSFVESNFADCFDLLKDKKFNGIVMDLGVSSMQIDQGARGFSFLNDGPLDMRMSSSGMSAADFVNNASQEEIANVIYKYGDETHSRKIAKRIIEERAKGLIETTGQLADIVRGALRVRGKIDSATKTFQGIRIHVNQELASLERFLENVENIMAPGARLVTVSFHSLEDRIIKHFIKEHSKAKRAKSKYSKIIDPIEQGKWIRQIHNKPVTPGAEETRANPRSRSAKLRSIIKEVDYAN
jgi:16S rRNA (cytosine1402-N4)-methyltransferase